MPLSILIKVLNTKKTFLYALYFITSETIALFEFMKDQLNKFFIYKCPWLRVICGNFTKQLTLVIARRKAEYQQVGYKKIYFFNYTNSIRLKQSIATWLRLVDIQKTCTRKSWI